MDSFLGIVLGLLFKKKGRKNFGVSYWVFSCSFLLLVELCFFKCVKVDGVMLLD